MHVCMLFFVAVSLDLVVTIQATKVVPITLAIVAVGDSPLYGNSTSSPAYEIAVDRARLLYPRVFQDFRIESFYRPDNTSTCEQSVGEMVLLLSSLFNATYGEETNRQTIIVTPACSFAVSQVGDFGREMDYVVIASMATDNSLTNDARYPTLLATGLSARYTLVQTTIELLKRYSWKRISVICDMRSHDPVYSSPLSLYEAFIRQSLGPASGINPLIQKVDSTQQIGCRFNEALKDAAAHSSVILLVSSDADVYLHFLTLAVDLGMDNGKYVFIITQFTEPPFRGDRLFGHSDIVDITLCGRIVRASTESILPFVFEIKPARMDLTNFADEWQAIAARTRIYSSGTIQADPATGVQVSAYESVLMLAQVLNETYDRLQNMTAVDINSVLCGRTFDLPTGKVMISEDGIRIAATCINFYDTASHTFKGLYKFIAGRLELVDESRDWTSRWNPFPPSADAFAKSGNFINNNYFFLLLALTGLLVPVMYKAMKKDAKWWCVDLTEVAYDDLPGRGANCQFPFSVGGHIVSQVAIDGRLMNYQIGRYRQQTVQVLRFTWEISFADVAESKGMLVVLQLMRNMDHPNVARFYGLSFMAAQKNTPRQILIISESPKKGLLRNFIDSGDMVFNWDFRSSLIWDILRALQYIHDSPLKFHGMLTFLNLIVDEHFTLKLTRTGGTQLFEALADTYKFTRCPIPLIANLWLSPEAINLDYENKSLPWPDAAADIYSLGVILYEMASRNIPFEVNAADTPSIRTKVKEISLGELDVEAYPVPCDAPKEIGEIAATLFHLNPNGDISVTEGILRRLEQYNNELEATVQARKLALETERRKVDILLSNILPKSIVQQLRDGETLVPDYFCSITVLFSDIPAFNDMVAVCAPFAVVDLLHRLYSKMDNVICQSDVYKVETIKDSYMVASGLPERNGDRHAMEIAKVALQLLEASSTIALPVEYAEHSQYPKLRIGVNSGPCVAAVIGQKQPRYCLVGDTINTASRMETQGEELRIHLTADTKALLDAFHFFRIEERGTVLIKGKGEMTTYWLSSLAASD